MSASPPPSPKDRVWSRREIEAQIASGRKIVIFKGLVLKTDAWIPYHPGGDKAIAHMVGRDGTDEITAYHSETTQALMHKFVIGTVQGRWENFVPPIQGGTFRPLETVDEEKAQHDTANEMAPNARLNPSSPRPGKTRSKTSADALAATPEARFSDALTADELTKDLATYPPLDAKTQDDIASSYRRLDQMLHAEGFYQCRYHCYAYDFARCAVLFILFATLLHHAQYALSGLFLGLFWWQLVFTAHDAAHTAITHNYHVDTCISIVIADFVGGLSIGWWKRNHNVHHLVTNAPEHDPDIEHLPFFAISHRFFGSLRSSYYERLLAFDGAARFFVKYQHLLYYPILLFGRFNLYVLSWLYLASPTQSARRGAVWWHRHLELAGQVVFWYWFGYQTLWLRIPTWSARLAFVFVSHMVTAPLHVQLTLSHFAMSTADLGARETFAQRMLRTTMDVDCPAWLGWVHGGLQFQVLHHLFPRIPRHNLARGQKYLRAFSDEVGVPYVTFGFVRGNKEVVGKLGEVAAQLRVMEECSRVAAKDLLQGHHGRL